jgi:hypothetical protein
MNRNLALLLALFTSLLAPSAQAFKARLLSEDGPNVVPIVPVSPDVPASTGAEVADERGVRLLPQAPEFLPHLAVAIGAGIVTVPAGLLLTSFVGSLSNTLLGAAIPSLLIMGLLAPTLVTGAAMLFGNRGGGGRYGYWLAWGATFLVNTAAMIVAGVLGLSVGLPAQLIAFSVIDGVLLGAASVGTMRFFEKAPAGVATIPSFVPGVTATQLLPLAQVAL